MLYAALAQQVERRLGKAEVGGSSPLGSFGEKGFLRHRASKSLFCEDQEEGKETRMMIDRLEKGARVGIVCCSNGRKRSDRSEVIRLGDALRATGLEPVFSEYIFEKKDASAGDGAERAGALMDLYQDPSIRAIYDISGGDIANEILPELDFSVIAQQTKQFWGYSDLTTILNAIYAKTDRSSVLYQVRNLVSGDGERQREDFRQTVLSGKRDLTDISCEFIQGERMEGIVVGGNIRCFLKLAGTPYLPDLHKKILLLEAYGGLVPQIVTYLSQLKQIGALEQAGGILLGTFTRLEKEEQGAAKMGELIRRFTGPDIPVARTRDIGHGEDARAIEIGGRIIACRSGRINCAP